MGAKAVNQKLGLAGQKLAIVLDDPISNDI